MTAGLPGVGIGGMFYLASALLMPLRAIHAIVTGRGRDARLPTALRQAAIAGAMLGAVWATGWAIGWLVAVLAPASASGGVMAAGVAVPVQNAVRTAAIVGSIVTLGVVLAGVELLRLWLPPRPTPRVLPADAPDATQSAA